MGAIVSISSAVNLATGGGNAPLVVPFFKEARVGAAAAVATIVGRYTSLWQYAGSPGAGAIPGSSTPAIPTDATAGSLIASIGPVGQMWLTGLVVVPGVAGTYILYDRLLHQSSLSGTVTTAQTVGGTITRNTGGVGNQIWVEIYTQIGATGTTITASYTNQAATSGRTTQAVVFGGTGFREAQRMIMLPLQSGDTGVQSVQNITVLVSTATAGDFGVTLAKPLAVAPCPLIGVGLPRDFLVGLPGVPEVVTDACLASIWMPNTVTAPWMFGYAALLDA